MRKSGPDNIKILLIEKDFSGSYWIFKEGSTITSKVSLEEAVELLKEERLDLIISEPHHLYILNHLQ